MLSSAAEVQGLPFTSLVALSLTYRAALGENGASCCAVVSAKVPVVAAAPQGPEGGAHRASGSRRFLGGRPHGSWWGPGGPLTDLSACGPRHGRPMDKAERRPGLTGGGCQAEAGARTTAVP